MGYQAKAYDAYFWYIAKNDIKSYEPDFVQWMESDATASRIIYWRCQKMININKHRSNHQKITRFPAFPVERTHYNCWNQKMEN